MKKIIVLMSAVLLLTACGASRMTADQKVARDEQVVRTVTEAIDRRHYMVEADYMYPRRGSGRHLDYGYSVEVRGDTLVSYLPYFGRAYNIPYGGGKALNFTAPISKYSCRRVKDHLYRIEMIVNNEEDILHYSLEMYDTGQTTIHVASREREQISFSGQFAESKKKK